MKYKFNLLLLVVLLFLSSVHSDRGIDTNSQSGDGYIVMEVPLDSFIHYVRQTIATHANVDTQAIMLHVKHSGEIIATVNYQRKEPLPKE